MNKFNWLTANLQPKLVLNLQLAEGLLSENFTSCQHIELI